MRKLVLVFMLLFSKVDAQAVYLSDTRPLVGYGWTLTKDQVASLMRHVQHFPRHPCITAVNNEDSLYLVFKIHKRDGRYADGMCCVYLEGRKEAIAKIDFHQTHPWSGFYILPLLDDAVLAELHVPRKLKFKFKKVHWIY